MMKINGWAILILGILLSGCSTTAPGGGPDESREDVQETLSAVAGAISGKSLDEEDLKDLENALNETTRTVKAEHIKDIKIKAKVLRNVLNQKLLHKNLG